MFYDYEYGHAKGNGTATVSRTASLLQLEVVLEMVVLVRDLEQPLTYMLIAQGQGKWLVTGVLVGK